MYYYLLWAGQAYGNSNWFIFSILIMYLITYISSKITKNKINSKTNAIITILSLIYIVIMYFLKDSYWYNITLCYVAGLWYGLYKDKVDKMLKSKYLFVIIANIILFIALYILRGNLIIYEILSVEFCLLIVFTTYKVKIGNKILDFLGKYSFEIYILQRIPDIILQKYLNNYIYLYFFMSLGITLIISMIFKKITNKLNSIRKE